MARFYKSNKHTRLTKYIGIPLIAGYLLLLTVALLVSPTSASFTDSQTITGKLSASDQFGKNNIPDEEQVTPNETTKEKDDNSQDGASTVERTQEQPKQINDDDATTEKIPEDDDTNTNIKKVPEKNVGPSTVETDAQSNEANMKENTESTGSSKESSL